MAVFQVVNRTTGDHFTCQEGQSVLKAMEQRDLKLSLIHI